VSSRVALSGVPTVFLILTDHDRAGYNMAEHVERVIAGNGEDDYPGLVRLACESYGDPVPPLGFVRVGLNAAQVEHYEVMTRDPKPSEHPGMLQPPTLIAVPRCAAWWRWWRTKLVGSPSAGGRLSLSGGAGPRPRWMAISADGDRCQRGLDFVAT
jgi:hypothetical protein